MSFFSKIGRDIYEELAWVVSPTKFGPGISSKDDYLNLIYPFPVTIGLLVLRYALHKCCFVPLGHYLGIKDTKRKNVNPNPVLEETYKKWKKRSHSQITGLAKQLDISEREIEIWMRDREKQDHFSTLMKFSESSWKLCYYIFIFTFGVAVLWDKPWFWDIEESWTNYPQQVLTTDLWLHATISISFYWSLLFGQFLMDVKRKDFWQMVVHHIITIFLISCSFLIRGYRIGSLVIMLHDISDIFLEGAKVARYAKKQELCTFCFVILVTSWIITRMVIYPSWIIRFTVITTPKHLKIHYVFNGMLVSLFFLHCYWLYLILKIAANAVASGQLGDDIRSSSEDTDDN